MPRRFEVDVLIPGLNCEGCRVSSGPETEPRSRESGGGGAQNRGQRVQLEGAAVHTRVLRF